jgi:hypothetical protein
MEIKKAWLTVEDYLGSSQMEYLPEYIIEEFDNLDIKIAQSTDYCFVLEVCYEDFDELQELVSVTSHLLINAKIFRYKTTLNCEEQEEIGLEI